MKKSLIILMVILLCVCFNVHASVEIIKVQDKVFGECHKMSNGTVDVVVAPKIGRIVFYGFTGETNQLWINRQAVEYSSNIGGWDNWGGDKVWVWPQNDWNKIMKRMWPAPFDGDAWKANIVSNKGTNYLSLTSNVIPEYGVSAIRSIVLSESGTKLTVNTRFVQSHEQKKEANIAFAIWTVTQVPAGDKIYARILPKGKLGAYGFSDPMPWAKFKTVGDSRVLLLERDGQGWYKGGFEADLLAVRNKDVVMVQKVLSNTELNKYKPGDQVQVCSSPDTTPCYPSDLSPYLELEFTSPIQRINHELEIQWSLYKDVLKNKTDKQIARWIDTL